jgi:hypothetical protein
MLDVILARFPLAVGGEVEFTDDLAKSLATSAEARLLAAEVWDQLTDNERLVCGILDLPVREMADTIGLSRSTAQRAATAAREVLAGFLSDVDDQVGVVAELALASAVLRTRGTARTGSASGIQEDK